MTRDAGVIGGQPAARAGRAIGGRPRRRCGEVRMRGCRRVRHPRRLPPPGPDPDPVGRQRRLRARQQRRVLRVLRHRDQHVADHRGRAGHPPRRGHRHLRGVALHLPRPARVPGRGRGASARGLARARERALRARAVRAGRARRRRHGVVRPRLRRPRDEAGGLRRTGGCATAWSGWRRATEPRRRRPGTRCDATPPASGHASPRTRPAARRRPERRRRRAPRSPARSRRAGRPPRPAAASARAPRRDRRPGWWPGRGR